MRKAMVLGVLGLAGTLASPTFAADDFSGFRLGMNMSSDTLDADLFFEPALATENFRTGRFGYGLFGGWALNRYLAFETGLRSGGEFNANPFDDILADPSTDFIVSHTDVKGIDITVVGSLWIGKKFSIFGRLGMFGWKAEQTMSVGSYATRRFPPARPPCRWMTPASTRYSAWASRPCSTVRCFASSTSRPKSAISARPEHSTCMTAP